MLLLLFFVKCCCWTVTGKWISDNRATLNLGPWNNQYGNDILWEPIKQPGLQPTLRVQVSIDGAKTWLREATPNPAGFTIRYKVCEKVDSCSPNDNGQCYDCHEGHNTLAILGKRFGKGTNGDEQNRKCKQDGTAHIVIQGA